MQLLIKIKFLLFFFFPAETAGNALSSSFGGSQTGCFMLVCGKNLFYKKIIACVLRVEIFLYDMFLVGDWQRSGSDRRRKKKKIFTM